MSWLLEAYSECMTREMLDYREDLEAFKKWHFAKSFDSRAKIAEGYATGSWQLRVHEKVFMDALMYYNRVVDNHEYLEMHDKEGYAEVIKPFGAFEMGQLFAQDVHNLTDTRHPSPAKMVIQAIRHAQATEQYVGYIIRRTGKHLAVVIFLCCLDPDSTQEPRVLVPLDSPPPRRPQVEPLNPVPHELINMTIHYEVQSLPSCSFLAGQQLAKYTDSLPQESVRAASLSQSHLSSSFPKRTCNHIGIPALDSPSKVP